MNKNKPNFLIIGSAKCGTTALASILGSHPDCCMSDPKEVSFFQDTMDYKINPNFEKGWEWYKKAFAHYKGEPMLGEATPSYSDRTRSPKTAERIYEFNPNMKLIYMVRSPYQRQVSAWKMHYTFGKENLSPWRREDKWALIGFEYWMQKQKEAGQWDECRYNFQLEAYRDYFDHQQILVSFLEDWRRDKAGEVRRVLEFLGLSPEKYDPNFKERANRTTERTIQRPLLKSFRDHQLVRVVVKLFPSKFRDYARNNIAVTQVSVPEPSISFELKQEFLEYVKEDNNKLLSYCGKPLDFWGIGTSENKIQG